MTYASIRAEVHAQQRGQQARSRALLRLCLIELLTTRMRLMVAWSPSQPSYEKPTAPNAPHHAAARGNTRGCTKPPTTKQLPSSTCVSALLPPPACLRASQHARHRACTPLKVSRAAAASHPRGGASSDGAAKALGEDGEAAEDALAERQCLHRYLFMKRCSWSVACSCMHLQSTCTAWHRSLILQTLPRPAGSRHRN